MNVDDVGDLDALAPVGQQALADDLTAPAQQTVNVASQDFLSATDSVFLHDDQQQTLYPAENPAEPEGIPVHCATSQFTDEHESLDEPEELDVRYATSQSTVEQEDSLTLQI